MKFFDKLAARIDEALIAERIRALPLNRRRALLAKLVEENKATVTEWLTG